MQEAKRELGCIENWIEGDLESFGKGTRAEICIGSHESARKHIKMYKKRYDWHRSMKRKNIASAESKKRTDDQGGWRNQGSMKERTPFPTFNGKRQSWSNS